LPSELEDIIIYILMWLAEKDISALGALAGFATQLLAPRSNKCILMQAATVPARARYR
jgi:hypothetical protein